MSIRQVLTSCTIQRISLIPLVCRLDSFWHPVQSNTFPRSPWYVGLDTCQCIFFCVMDVAYHFHICSPNGILIHKGHAFSIYYILGRIWYDSLQTSSYLVRSGLIFCDGFSIHYCTWFILELLTFYKKIYFNYLIIPKYYIRKLESIYVWIETINATYILDMNGYICC